ncbi:MAG: site-2 protease family protein [Chloroflexi bacterium]|nr:site-2 protease family protein [Chloroflexota bacterium]
MFNFLNELQPSVLISHLVVLVVAFTIHEFAHAWTANSFGDTTPGAHGRLTLNPLAHLDPLGSLLLLVAGFGWAKPVPVNPFALQRRAPSAMMWVSLAGPLSNLLMALLAAIPFKLGLVNALQAYLDVMAAGEHFLPTLPQLLFTFVELNLLLMLFNLIPIAPLDGEKIAEYFFPPAWQRALETIRPFGPLILMALVFLGLFSIIIYPPMTFLLGLLVG